MLIVHAGNRIDAPDRPEPRFPAAHADSISERLAVLLAAVRADRVVTAAAGGADLLLLRVAAEMGVATTIVLPLDVDDFRHRSVDDQEGPWSGWFDDALAAADEIVVEDLSHEDEWYLLGNEIILDAASARTAGHPLVVAVRAGRGSATDDFVERAVGRGWEVVDLDPSIDPAGRRTIPIDSAALADAPTVAALVDLDLGWTEVHGPEAVATLPSDVVARRDELRAVLPTA